MGRNASRARQGLLGEAAGQERTAENRKALSHRAARRCARIGCNTFPTWNGYPGLFASLATGNAVVVKPHPNAILPLAITVQIARDVLAEAGFSPDVVTLVAHAMGDDTAQKLALRPEIRLIDFTGSSANGEWLERNAHQAQVYTEKAGVNQIIIDSVDDIKSVARNIAFSLALYTGQMCTAPQNIYVPRDGIATADGHLSFDQVALALTDAVEKLVGDPARAVEILGAIVNDGVAARIVAARALGTTSGTMLLDSRTLAHPQFPQARIATPMLIKLDAGDGDQYLKEWFGPIAFVVATDSTAQSLDIARRAIADHGALTLSLYARDAAVVDAVIALAEAAGVALSINLTGGVFVTSQRHFPIFTAPGRIRLPMRR